MNAPRRVLVAPCAEASGRARLPAHAGGLIVGEQEGLREVMNLVRRVASADAPVLVVGETGSGKEVVARAIHERSPRAGAPIVRVNCGAIPPELVDSELFGHERGSFTGAVGERKGWFERADGGTLFLDEVGELPLAAQVRLLRVLQDGTFERVGGQRPLSVDVRVVVATHRDLSEMVGSGLFRRDLWYRLSVFPIRIPPLRARPEDVATLAAHFAAIAGERIFGAPVTPTTEDLALLRAQSWPGNVRELAAVIERAALLGGGRRLEIPAALEQAALLDGGTPPLPQTPTFVHGESDARVAGFKTLDTVVIEHIERTLMATSGRIEGPGGAASLLDVNPHTLRARMRKLGIAWARFRPSAARVPEPAPAHPGEQAR